MQPSRLLHVWAGRFGLQLTTTCSMCPCCQSSHSYCFRPLRGHPPDTHQITVMPAVPCSGVVDRYGPALVQYGQDPNFQRQENTGFANALVSLLIVQACIAWVQHDLAWPDTSPWWRFDPQHSTTSSSTQCRSHCLFTDTLLRSAMSMAYNAAHLTVNVVCLQAFFYQVKLETEIDEPPATRLASVSLADIIM